jgi:hypothetical protein
MPHRAALSRISHAKNRNLAPDDLYKESVNCETEALAAVSGNTASLRAQHARLRRPGCSRPSGCCAPTRPPARPESLLRISSSTNTRTPTAPTT